VARGFAGKPKHLQLLMKAAVKHQGFAFIDVLQPCFTFFNTYDFYNKRVYELTDKAHDSSDREAAFIRAREWSYGEGERIPIGIFYQAKKPTYDERLLKGRIPVKLKPGNIRSILEKHI
jgi:2-oxoglutarate ferredoxin oxidoreductase subunit beta